jgi:hypothetical protein
MSEIETFELSVVWPEGISPGEQDAAAISLQVNQEILTRLADVHNEKTRTFLRGSAVSLGLWIAENWWRLRYEPYPPTLVPPTDWRLRHELTSVSGGTTWPPIMIYGEGTRVIVAPRFGVTDVEGPVRYLNTPVVSVDGKAYERGIDTFLTEVLQKCSQALDADTLHALVSELTEERADHAIACWRRLEAMLGYDADRAPEALITAMQKFENQIGLQAVEECAVSAPGPEAALNIERAVSAVLNSEVIVDLGVARKLKSYQSRLSPRTEPWRLAESAAQEVRQKIGIPKGPILSSNLADVLQITKDRIKEAHSTAANLPYGAVGTAKQTTEKSQIALQAKATSGRRFEIARALGDAAWDSHAKFAPVSRAKSTRQKFQRTFAQSFLCPFPDLIEYMGTNNTTDQDVIAAALHFHVSENVIRTLLVNKEIIPRERLEDRLEAA